MFIRSTKSTTAGGARTRTPERSVGARGERIELPSAESKNESLWNQAGAERTPNKKLWNPWGQAVRPYWWSAPIFSEKNSEAVARGTWGERSALGAKAKPTAKRSDSRCAEDDVSAHEYAEHRFPAL